ncbi:TetR/AcrR family transcriptional regulator C-terminal domain-containing protein [Mycobacterium sp. NPDC003323]
MDGPPTTDVPRRPRGRPPKISREQIVAATRRIPARDLSMQAVADALSVSRKALHYYVGDRQGLLSLVVTDRFEAELTDVELPRHTDWQAVIRSYARAFRAGLVQIGVTIEHTPLQGAGAAAALGLAERVIAALLDAGFGAADARRALTAVAGIAQQGAHTALIASAGQHDYGAETVDALDSVAAEHYPALRSVVSGPAPTPLEQFEFELDIVIAGMAVLLQPDTVRNRCPMDS